MTKKLHLVLYPSKKKWIVTQIQINRFLRPDDAENLEVKFKNNFKNRLTKSAIFSGKELLGDIYFSLV